MTQRSNEELLARIDERTASMKEQQDKLVEAFTRHIEQDRADFQTVANRLNKVEKKQAWILGVGTGLGAFVGVLGTMAKDWITNGGSQS